MMDYPLWFAELENYEPEDGHVVMAEMLLDLKENVFLERKVNKENVFYISIKSSHTYIFNM